MTQRILIVDDEKNIRRTLGMILRAEGFAVSEAASAEEGLRALDEEGADLLILDVRLPGLSGIEMLREVKRSDPDRMVLMISGEGSIAAAVEATREGAFDFLEKPLAKERVLLAVRNALRLRSLGREYRELKSGEEQRHVLIGESAALREVRDAIAKAAPSGARILICGESGTGKELVARAIHDASERKDGPFVKVNCAAIPDELIESELFGAVKGSYTGADVSRDGKFVRANGGTLFLDEVGDMSLKAQAKVLRAIQEGEIEKVGGTDVIRVDARVLAATNKDLHAETAAGRFREDLYFRLNVIPIRVPPLRERREDVPKLATHFLERFRLENNRPPLTFTNDALAALARLDWPGNVRELANVVERLAIMVSGPEIDAGELASIGLLEGSAPPTPPRAEGVAPLSPGQLREFGGLVEARRRFEAACIREALRTADGNVSEAARLLGIDRTNLHKKIQAYGIGTEESSA